MKASAPETVVTLLKKIYVLSLGGATSGEREAAESRLAVLLKKYELTLDDILEAEEKKEWHVFKIKGKYEQRLFFQVYAMVTDSNKYVGKATTRKITIYITTRQYIEIDLYFQAYRRALEEELEACITGFIYTNNIFRKTVNQSKASKEDIEKLEQAIKYMRNMKKTVVHKALPPTSIAS